MIALSTEECCLFKTICDCLHWKQSTTVARVAGGWVRDKLLSRCSCDVDIALDNLSGIEFAEYLNAFLASIGEETKTIAIIQANPDQSKHLETANIRVHGFEIDCVNLRAESYADHSRIPEIRFGTVLEDALRRDFTINSLFYNLCTQEIEDCTGLGLSDLSLGIVRTPLPPLTTFQDDPLRVFRAIRFASRLNFLLDEELVVAARSEDIHLALVKKVSRERVLKECEGMFNDAGCPAAAVLMIHSLGLFNTVLLPPNRDVVYRDCAGAGSSGSAAVADIASQLDRAPTVGVLTSVWCAVVCALETEATGASSATAAVVVTKEVLLSQRGGPQQRLLYWAAVVAGLRELHTSDCRKTRPLASVTLRDSLKMDNDTMKIVQVMLDKISLIQAYSVSHVLCHEGSSGSGSGGHVASDGGNSHREQAGVVMRECSEHWRSAVTLACACELADAGLALSSYSSLSSSSSLPAPPLPTDMDCSSTSPVCSVIACVQAAVVCDVTVSAEQLAIIARYTKLAAIWTNAFLLHGVWEMKPLYDGTQLLALIPSLKKGPLVSIVIQQQILWQLRHASDMIGAPDLGALVKFLTEVVCQESRHEVILPRSQLAGKKKNKC